MPPRNTFRGEAGLARWEPNGAFSGIPSVNEQLHTGRTMFGAQAHMIGRAFVCKV